MFGCFCAAAARTDSNAVGCYADKGDDRVFTDKMSSESMTPSVSTRNAHFDYKKMSTYLCTRSMCFPRRLLLTQVTRTRDEPFFVVAVMIDWFCSHLALSQCSTIISINSGAAIMVVLVVLLISIVVVGVFISKLLPLLVVRLVNGFITFIVCICCASI